MSLTHEVLQAAFEVSNTLGCGFLEKVYHHAIITELTLRGLNVQSEAQFEVSYKGRPAGHYQADLVVNDQLILELKCVDRFASEHYAQCLNYVKASGLTVCLLLSFHRPTVQWKRIILGTPPESLLLRQSE